MPLGDSLTDGFSAPGGYRLAFAAAARRAHFSFTFVGSLENGPPELASRRHEGHNGWRIRQIDAKLDEWLGESQPDVILLLIGTNDILMQDDPANAPGRLRLLLQHLSDQRPEARVLVSSLPPLADATLQASVEHFNATLPALVTELARAGRRVRLVDLAATFRSSDLVDGVHLSADANRRLGERWFHAAVGR